MRFNDMPLSDGTKDAVAAMGYEDTTPIQELAIPHLLDGKDVVGRARTGTGKTAAFGIPMVEALQTQRGGIRGLVLVPTRELANQVKEVLRDIARASGIKVVAVFGGVGFGPQIKSLQAKETTIVVACPGRLLDLHNRGDIELRDVSFLVLDEADRMLDMGFVHDMRRIAKIVPDERQTALFSATLDERVRGIAKEFVWKDAVTVEVPGSEKATSLTDQFHVKVEKSDKLQTLMALLDEEKPDKAVVFTKMKHQARRVAQRLNQKGWASVALQGNMSQSQRDRAMEAFRSGDARLLVATDVAARGLDVPDITHVFNHDLPMEDEAYVHRIGRTGRNGSTGRSFTFVQSDEHKKWRVIQDLAGSQVPTHPVGGNAEANGPDQPLHLAPQQPKRTGGARRPGQGGQGGHGGHSGQGGGRHRGGPRRSGPRSGGPRGNGPRASGPRTSGPRNGGSRRNGRR